MPKHYKGRSHGGGSAPYSRSGVYNAYGQPVRNVESYAATGAPTYTSSGSRIRNPSAYTGAIEASYRQNTSTPKYLYHYTSNDAADAIASSGKVKASSSGACGSGTYWTSKAPTAKSKFPDWKPPTKIIGSMSYKQWSERARRIDREGIDPEAEHYYLMMGTTPLASLNSQRRNGGGWRGDPVEKHFVT